MWRTPGPWLRSISIGLITTVIFHDLRTENYAYFAIGLISLILYFISLWYYPMPYDWKNKTWRHEHLWQRRSSDIEGDRDVCLLCGTERPGSRI